MLKFLKQRKVTSQTLFNLFAVNTITLSDQFCICVHSSVSICWGGPSGELLLQLVFEIAITDIVKLYGDIAEYLFLWNKESNSPRQREWVEKVPVEEDHFSFTSFVVEVSIWWSDPELQLCVRPTLLPLVKLFRKLLLLKLNLILLLLCCYFNVFC